jgi:hypothetical protein
MLSSDVLFAFVRSRHSDFAKLSFDPKPQAPYAGADVWLLASLVQKAVRRGDRQTARRAGHQLLALDAPRLWRRIMTLALEDIGIGDIEACATLVGIATSKETRRLLDPHALDVALALGCGARKDRSSDHLTSILRIAHTERDALAAASPNALLAVMASSSQPWQRRLEAAHLAETLLKGPESATIFARFAEMGVPEPLVAASRVYHRRGRDGLAVLTCLAWTLWAAEPDGVRLQAPAPVSLIGDLPDYAFDPLHTRLGQRAIELWLRSYMTKLPFTTRQAAIALWNEESAFCDRVLDWPLGLEIGRCANAADLEARHVPKDRRDALRAWVVGERAVLSLARKSVWESQMRECSSACEPPPRPEPMF